MKENILISIVKNNKILAGVLGKGRKEQVKQALAFMKKNNKEKFANDTLKAIFLLSSSNPFAALCKEDVQEFNKTCKKKKHKITKAFLNTNEIKLVNFDAYNEFIIALGENAINLIAKADLWVLIDIGKKPCTYIKAKEQSLSKEDFAKLKIKAYKDELSDEENKVLYHLGLKLEKIPNNTSQKFYKSEGKFQPQNKKELKKLLTCETIFLENIDTSLITDMSSLFEKSLRKDFSGIGSWDTSKVCSMKKMFKEAENFNEELNSWDLSSVVDMRKMFYGASRFHQNLDSWGLSIVFSKCKMNEMFIKSPLQNTPPKWYKLEKAAYKMGFEIKEGY